MDQLKAMATFVRIAEAGGFTAAARSLDASVPAVVRSLAALEASLGVRLFNRTTRRVALTEEGRRYLDHCRAILAAVADAGRAVSSESSAIAGPLMVTAPVMFGQLHVAPAVTRFAQRHREVQIELVLLDRVVNLLDEGFDVGIRIGALDDSSLVARHIGAVRRMVVASPSYLRRHGVPRHPRELAQLECVRLSGGARQLSFHEQGKVITVPVRGSLRCNHVPAVVDACVAGLGCGVFMSYQVDALLKAGKLKAVLEAFEPPPRPVSLLVPQARMLPARTRAFIDWMLRELRGFKGQA
ncbi:MAG TPA: LysR family transcriptional regulator [Burkholderiaceae bacterium]|nr:LysR family transcriptional regulator [Burkholderiaceae bacterium]